MSIITNSKKGQSGYSGFINDNNPGYSGCSGYSGLSPAPIEFTKAAYVANATSETIVAQYNALIQSLKNAGFIYISDGGNS